MIVAKCDVDLALPQRILIRPQSEGIGKGASFIIDLPLNRGDVSA
jgi:hypothetical protein